MQTEGLRGRVLQHGVQRLLAALHAESPRLLLRELQALVPEFATRNVEFQVPVSGAVASVADLAAAPAVALGATPFDISRRLADAPRVEYAAPGGAARP